MIKEIVQKYDIKIGNTIYSKIEFENKRIDPKTYYYLLLMQENWPQNYEQVFNLYSEKFKYKTFDYERFIQEYHKNEMINFAKEFSEEISNNLKV